MRTFICVLQASFEVKNHLLFIPIFYIISEINTTGEYIINIYILNGPPGSGKDTIADRLAEVLNNAAFQTVVWRAAFKDELYRATYDWLCGTSELSLGKVVGDLMAVTNCTFEDFKAACEDRVLKEAKVIPVGIHFNLASNPKDFGHKCWSPRMCLQHVSENLAKPRYGSDIFGVKALAAAKAMEENGLEAIVYSDGGFVEEIEYMAKHYPTTVINVYRDGYTFEGDSRDYVTEGKLVKEFHRLENNGLISAAVNRALLIMQE